MQGVDEEATQWLRTRPVSKGCPKDALRMPQGCPKDHLPITSQAPPQQHAIHPLAVSLFYPFGVGNHQASQQNRPN